MSRARTLLRELSDIFTAPERYTLHLAARSVGLSSASVSVSRSRDSVEFMVAEDGGEQLLITLPMSVEGVEQSRLLKYHIDRLRVGVMTSYDVEYAKFTCEYGDHCSISGDVVVQHIGRGVALDRWCEQERDRASVAAMYRAISLLDETLRSCNLCFVGRGGIAANGVVVGEDALLYPFRYANLSVGCASDDKSGCEQLRKYVEGRFGWSEDALSEELQSVKMAKYEWRSGECFEGHLYSGELNEERVLVEDTTGWGFVDGENRVVVESRYLRALPFDEGRAMVQSESGWGLIDLYGEEVIPAKYDGIEYRNKSGVSCVRRGDKWSYFSYRGEQLTPFNIDYPNEDITQEEVAEIINGLV